MAHPLSAAHEAALAAIVAGELAWTTQADLEARGVAEATLVELEGREYGGPWVERWRLKRGPAWTLSPWAGSRLEVEILEHWEYGAVEERGARVRVAEEVPRWGPIGGAARPIRLPGHARMGPLTRPELVRAPGPGPEAYLDDDGRAVMLFGVPLHRKRSWH